MKLIFYRQIEGESGVFSTRKRLPSSQTNSRSYKINEALESKLDIPTFDSTGHVPPFEELFKIVEILLNNGFRKVTEHHLPYPDVSVSMTKASLDEKNDFRKIRSFQFSDNQARKYIESFLRHFESAYKEFIEYAFPTLKENFPFFMEMPHEYFVYMKDDDVHKWGYLGYRPSKSGYVEINYRKIDSINELYDSVEVKIFRGFSLDQIIRNDYYDTVKTIDKINTSEVDDYCVLRSWIYRYLKEDIGLLFKENDV